MQQFSDFAHLFFFNQDSLFTTLLHYYITCKIWRIFLFLQLAALFLHLVSEGSHPVGVRAGEGVVVQVRGADGGPEQVGEGAHRGDAGRTGHGHAAA